MVALDERSGEFLAREENESLREEVLSTVSGLFNNAATLEEDLDGKDGGQGTLEQLLLVNKLSYRLFTTTIALRQSRWSF